MTMFDDNDTPESTTRPPADSLVEADAQAVKRGDVDLTESKVMAMTNDEFRAFFVKTVKRSADHRRKQNDRMAKIESANASLRLEIRDNTHQTKKGVDWARLSAIATPIFLAIISSLGEWGHQHPEAKISAALVLVAGLFVSTSKGDRAAHVATSPTIPPPAPPHS